MPLLPFVLLGLFAVTTTPDTPASRTLEHLRALEGRWEGTLEWTGARSGTGTVRAEYQVMSARSVVEERLFMGSDSVPSMTTLYHLDGSDLRMTHYCAAQNQPRLRASTIDEAQHLIRFEFVDGTNLVSHPGHVDAFEIQFVAEDRLVLIFTFAGAGSAKSFERIELKRRREAAPSPHASRDVLAPHFPNSYRYSTNDITAPS